MPRASGQLLGGRGSEAVPAALGPIRLRDERDDRMTSGRSMQVGASERTAPRTLASRSTTIRSAGRLGLTICRYASISGFAAR